MSNKLTYTLFAQPAQPKTLSDIIVNHGLRMVVRERMQSAWGQLGETRYFCFLEFGNDGYQVCLSGQTRFITADGPTPEDAVANYRRAICGITIMVPDLSSGEEFGEDLIALAVPSTLAEEPAFQNTRSES